MLPSKQLDQQLLKQLQQRKSVYHYRERLQVNVSDSQLFCSNDYLGLSKHPKVINAFSESISEVGVGSGASHLVSGHHEIHHQLEQALAVFTGRPRALLFSNGYMANMAVISTLLQHKDRIIEDRLNHASLIDGAVLSRAQFKRFRHNDMQHLSELLNKEISPEKRTIVAVDGVFSMDGDTVLLPELAEICQQNQALLMVDDAHGFGVLGDNGGGISELFDLGHDRLPILMGTFSKAFGTYGAFIAGSEVLIESLIQTARPYIYTTALPPAIAAATLKSLQIIQEEAWRRQHLQSLIIYFKTQANSLRLPLLPSSTPIQPIIIGCERLLMSIADELRHLGFYVGTIRPPTVPKDTARLRVTLSALHQTTDVDHVLIALDNLIPNDMRVVL